MYTRVILYTMNLNRVITFNRMRVVCKECGHGIGRVTVRTVPADGELNVSFGKVTWRLGADNEGNLYHRLYGTVKRRLLPPQHVLQNNPYLYNLDQFQLEHQSKSGVSDFDGKARCRRHIRNGLVTLLNAAESAKKQGLHKIAI